MNKWSTSSTSPPQEQKETWSNTTLPAYSRGQGRDSPPVQRSFPLGCLPNRKRSPNVWTASPFPLESAGSMCCFGVLFVLVGLMCSLSVFVLGWGDSHASNWTLIGAPPQTLKCRIPFPSPHHFLVRHPPGCKGRLGPSHESVLVVEERSLQVGAEANVSYCLIL
jgi:hypothetical protein